MHRRSVLHASGRAIAAGGCALIAGCLAGTAPPGAEDDPTERPDTNRSSSDDNSATGDPVIDESPRIDEPPHPIEVPEERTPEGWNEHYLGETMDREPSLAVEELEHVPVTDQFENVTAGREFRVRIGRSEDDLADLLADPSMVDLDGRLLVVVGSGYGSSSVRHEWARIEDANGELHLHGYYTQPIVQTDDVSGRQSVLAVEDPGDPVDIARVRLTVAEDERVRFNSTEGVVSPAE